MSREVCEKCQRVVGKRLAYADGTKLKRNWENLLVCLSCFTSHPNPPNPHP